MAGPYSTLRSCRYQWPSSSSTMTQLVQAAIRGSSSWGCCGPSGSYACWGNLATSERSLPLWPWVFCPLVRPLWVCGDMQTNTIHPAWLLYLSSFLRKFLTTLCTLLTFFVALYSWSDLYLSLFLPSLGCSFFQIALRYTSCPGVGRDDSDWNDWIGRDRHLLGHSVDQWRRLWGSLCRFWWFYLSV